MFGGKYIDGKIKYRENSESYPSRDGYLEHENKEVIRFFLEEQEIANEYRNMPDTVNGKSFIYEFPKDRPGHIKVNTAEENKGFSSLSNCLLAAEKDRICYWSDYDEELSPLDREIARIIVSGLMVEDDHAGSKEEYSDLEITF